MERSVSGISSEERPIIKTRRVAETGGMMTGGAAHVGSVGLTTARRSDTSCRARIRSVPGFMISVMEDNCGTDFERITSRFSTPLSASSSGMVTWDSTSVEESPTDRVWTSTRGGANSGKTSTGIFRTSR